MDGALKEVDEEERKKKKEIKNQLKMCLQKLKKHEREIKI